jgi:hypothetical protein
VPGSRDWPGQPDAPDTPRQLRSGSPRPDSPPARSDEARPADRLAADDRPARWSRDDLRQRLERLPPGHPSSPQADDRDHSSPRENMEPYRQADAAERSFWSEKPRFLQAWADHVLRWPDERVAAAVDRSRDPAGSWRGDGNEYLNPEQHAQAKEEIMRVRRREEALTKHMEEVARENGCNGWLEGLEYRLKGDDRLKQKIATELGITPAMKPGDAINKLSDAIRYTFCFDLADYSDGYREVRHRLEAQEYRMVYSKNSWRDDPEYKGVNTRWITPDGQRFEVQFHTTESYYAKQHITHKSYERLRNPLTQDDERSELEAFQREVCLWIKIPEGAREIPDYGTKGR